MEAGMQAAEQRRALYTEHIPMLGLRAELSNLEPDIDRVRMRLRIENSGEKGNIVLMLDNCRLYLLNDVEAANWARNSAWLDACGKAGESLLGWTKIMSLHAENPTQFPRVLKPGDVWQGWIGTLDRRLPEDVAALVVMVGGLMPKKLAIPSCFYSGTTEQPLISLGTQFEAAKLSKPRRFVAGLIKQLRFHYYYAFPLTGMIAGMIGISSLLGWFWEPLRPLGLIGGTFLGYVLGNRLLWYLAMRKYLIKL